MTDPEPAEKCIRGTVFEGMASDAQLALPIGERFSLSDEQLLSIRALVADNTEKDAELAALRAENGRWKNELEGHRQDAIRNAWDSASRNKWQMFGYWAAIESHLRSVLRLPDSNGGPFKALRDEARRALEGRDAPEGPAAKRYK